MAEFNTDPFDTSRVLRRFVIRGVVVRERRPVVGCHGGNVASIYQLVRQEMP